MGVLGAQPEATFQNMSRHPTMRTRRRDAPAIKQSPGGNVKVDCGTRLCVSVGGTKEKNIAVYHCLLVPRRILLSHWSQPERGKRHMRPGPVRTRGAPQLSWAGCKDRQRSLLLDLKKSAAVSDKH